MNNSLTLTFVQGAGRVTGSNFLLESPDGSAGSPQVGTKILVDCGLVQGGKIFEDVNTAPFPYATSEISALFVTHAHLDHVGRIPKLVREGFKGRIISTPPTKEIGELIMLDSMGVMEKESRRDSKPMLYDKNDVARAMALWETVPYYQSINIGPFTIVLRDAGHILGSSMVEIAYEGKKIVFTGDLGNSPTPLLSDTEALSDIKYLIMESTYGDRNHENRDERQQVLERAIEDAVAGGGVVLIPAFSVERTQELLFELNEMIEHGRIPRVPVFLDSPLAISVTALYTKYQEYFNADARKIISAGDDVFAFPGFKMTKTTAESKAINEVQGPKIIIAGSGMSNGGRILHHEKRYLSNPSTTLLLIGYQAAGTLGRQLQDGARQINIMGEPVEVRAKTVQLSGYSAHKDSEHLLALAQDTVATLSKMYCVHGESKSAMFLAQKIRDNLGVPAEAPTEGEKVSLEF